MEQLASNIAYLIKESDKTQGEIADLLKTNKSNLSNWASGYAVPRLADFVAIAQFFKITTDDLLFRDLKTVKNQVNEQVAVYKNDDHLRLLIESYEIRLKLEQDLNAQLTTNHRELKTNYDNLQSALKANYIKQTTKKDTIKKADHR